MHATFSFAFSSRYVRTRTSNFRKVLWQHRYGGKYCMDFDRFCALSLYRRRRFINHLLTYLLTYLLTLLEIYLSFQQ